MQDKWELFWMGVIFFAAVMLSVVAWNWRIDNQRQSAWVSGYIAGYSEGKSGLPSRQPAPERGKP